MGRNLPPGVSVSDLPGNDPGPEPECFECSAYPSMEAMEDGYPLCEEHDTPENRAHYDEEIAARRERQAALEREQRAERDRPVPDEPLPQPLVPREVVEEQEDEEPRTDGGEGPVAYHVPNSDVSPLWCPDCVENVRRETEPLYEEDVENFDRISCIKCGLTVYVSEDDPGRVEIVGEIGDEDDPLTVRTEPVRNDEDAYGLALHLKTRGWRNVRGEEVDYEGAIRTDGGAERLTFSPTTFEEANIRDDGSLELSFTREQAERFWSVLDEELRTPTGRLSRGG